MAMREKYKREGELLSAYCNGEITKAEYLSDMAEVEDWAVGKLLDEILPMYAQIGKVVRE